MDLGFALTLAGGISVGTGSRFIFGADMDPLALALAIAAARTEAAVLANFLLVFCSASRFVRRTEVVLARGIVGN